MKTTVIGLQYGDEGKGRVVGYFSKDYDWAVRFNGGPNAGHTVYDEEGTKFKLHHFPAGSVFGKKVALDTGMVINLDTLADEWETFKTKPEVFVSETVHIIQPKHLNEDSGGSGIGSTKRGIAYVYADRALRAGVRAGDVDFPMPVQKYKGLPPIQSDESAIFEGAQGIMLDVDYGAWPYVTSSSLMPSSAHRIDKFVGVIKAYTTRVGDGPPYHEDIEELRKIGDEFGTTTGRPRKCTWLDVDQIAYGLSIVQPDEVVVTKLDIMGKLVDECTDIEVIKGGEVYSIGSLDSYKDFLIYTFPQIKWFSEAPDGDLIKVR